jgi:hypothetical protein
MMEWRLQNIVQCHTGLSASRRSMSFIFPKPAYCHTSLLIINTFLVQIPTLTFTFTKQNPTVMTSDTCHSNNSFSFDQSRAMPQYLFPICCFSAQMRVQMDGFETAFQWQFNPLVHLHTPKRHLPHLAIWTSDLREDAHDRADQMKESHLDLVFN